MYSIKILFKYTINEIKEFFEESIIMLKATSFDDAYNKAEEYVQETIPMEWTNQYGQHVLVSVVAYVDCFQIVEDEEVTEVYSSFRINKSKLGQQEYIKLLTDCCESDELKELRRI